MNRVWKDILVSISEVYMCACQGSQETPEFMPAKPYTFHHEAQKNDKLDMVYDKFYILHTFYLHNRYNIFFPSLQTQIKWEVTTST